MPDSSTYAKFPSLLKHLQKDVGGGLHAPAVVIVDAAGSAQNPSDYVCLLSEAIAAFTNGDAVVLANAPVGTKQVYISVFTGPISWRSDGGTAVAGACHPMANDLNFPGVLPFNQAACLRFRAVNNGSTARAFVEYWG